MTMIVSELPEVESRAAKLMILAHAGQTDKRGQPYFLHPGRVANMVRLAGGTQDQVLAAYLHDTVEDTSVTLDDLAGEFGPHVAGLALPQKHPHRPELLGR